MISTNKSESFLYKTGHLIKIDKSKFIYINLDFILFAEVDVTTSQI